MLQLEDEDHSGEFFQAGDQGMTPNGVEYIRTFPAQFDEDTENKFMRKVIDEFALEKKTDKGQPSGVFVMNKATTKAMAKEVVARVKKLEGKELDAYVE